MSPENRPLEKEIPIGNHHFREGNGNNGYPVILGELRSQG